MSQITCKKCGQTLDSMNGKLGFCPYCGEKLSVQPEADAPNVQNLVARMYIFLEDGNFQNAFMYAERVLDMDFKCADAYLVKALVAFKLRKKEDLLNANIPFETNADFQRAVEYADTDLKQELEGIAEGARAGRKNRQFAYAVQAMNNAKTEQDFLKASELFKPLFGFENADSLYQICLQNAQNAAFDQAEQFINQNKPKSLQKAMEILKRLPVKNETAEKIAYCEEQIQILKKKKRKKLTCTGIIALVLVVALAASYFLYFADLFKYNKALDCIEEGDHKQAYELFEELGDFKDSKEHLDKFEWVVSKETETDSVGDQHVTEYQYNKDGLLEKITDDDQTVTEYQYNKDGLLAKITDDDQTVAEFQYNKDGLVTKEFRTSRDVGQYVIEYQYNKDGLNTKQVYTDSDGDQSVTEFQYNKDGLLAKITGGSQYVTEYQYNKDGLLTKATKTYTFGSQYVTEYQYNKDGLLTKETSNSDVTEYQYNKDGLVTKKVNTNFRGYQTVIEYQYNKDGLKTKEVYTYSYGGQSVNEYQYTLVYKKFGKEEKEKQ